MWNIWRKEDRDWKKEVPGKPVSRDKGDEKTAKGADGDVGEGEVENVGEEDGKGWFIGAT